MTTSREEPAAFKVRVNLVQVPVVVRDNNGRAVGTLTKEDFQLLDRGKAQFISRFSVERPGKRVVTVEEVPAELEEKAGLKPQPGMPAPERFVILLFDDLHTPTTDFVRVREAARRFAGSLKPTDRVALMTASGRTAVEFAAERGALESGFERLAPGLANRPPECPDLDPYMSDLIENKNTDELIEMAIADGKALGCIPDLADRATAETMVRGTAARVLRFAERDLQLTTQALRRAVSVLAAMPGERSVVMLSSGFDLFESSRAELSDVTERAVRAKVVIGALDARGLDPSSPFGDASTNRRGSIEVEMIKERYRSQSRLAQADALAIVSHGTGGVFFHNNNDLDRGFREVAAAPEFVYILGFSPQNLKPDGRFHPLKVRIAGKNAYTIAARNGYYAPKRPDDPAQAAKEEIQNAVFSLDEIRDLPIELRTQFFKPTDVTAKLTVLARVDIKRLGFRKADDRNRNDLTVVACIFDPNGRLVAGSEKLLQMRLRDATLASGVLAPVTVKSNFDLKPGRYLVRLVVRDAEQELLSAQNSAVEIP